jgi:ring-1,2-phenylacetyl-CoA epoxidase subunit PaaB
MKESEEDSTLWEVFVQPKNGLAHKHCGSVHASDKEMALLSARNVYTRRGEGNSIWVVRSEDIVSSNPKQKGENFTADDKIYRHPTFYDVPDDIGHM